MGFERALVSGTAILVPYLALSALLPFGIIYIMGVLRGRNGDKDPLLGAKVISCLLLTVAFTGTFRHHAARSLAPPDALARPPTLSP